LLRTVSLNYDVTDYVVVHSY